MEVSRSGPVIYPESLADLGNDQVIDSIRLEPPRLLHSYSNPLRRGLPHGNENPTPGFVPIKTKIYRTTSRTGDQAQFRRVAPSPWRSDSPTP